MPETAQQWYDRVSAAIAADGYRESDWGQWPTWPFDGELTPRRLDPPGEEQPRRGIDGVDCRSCQTGRELPAHDVLWFDGHYYLTWARGQALPFGAFLMPREHADLATLSPVVAARGGELLSLVERAAVDVLDVPRIQVARWGDGGEHLHWWLYARPTGMNQLRGTFLSHWDDILPVRDEAAQRADMVLVARRLAELAGGTARD